VKSINNYETYIKEKSRIEKETTKNLENIEKKINDGYSRSV